MVTEMRCDTCNAWIPNKDHKVKNPRQQMGWCRAKPPVVISVMMPNPAAAINPAAPPLTPGQQGAFPPVVADWWCREWAPLWMKNSKQITSIELHDEQPAA